MSNRKVFIQIIRFFLLTISIIGIWYIIQDWHRKKRFKQHLLAIIDHVRKANSHFEQQTNFERYFANIDEQLFLNTYRNTRKVIIREFDRIGLTNDIVEGLKRFCDNFDRSTTIRQDYNNQFVQVEAEKFADFFANLENYPLSYDQIEAIIRDEDNNLVIAGAGTGKTTTISGKVAYLLEKKKRALKNY